MIKNFIVGCGVGCLIIGALGMATALGWGAGEVASKIILRHRAPAVPAVYYCIKGQLYERIADTYVSVDSGRTCIPVDHD